MVPYWALHLMGFSVPPRLRLERWALTPPFHPYPAHTESVTSAPRMICAFARPRALCRFQKERGGMFSVALSVGMPHGIAPRVYPWTLSYEKWPGLRGITPF